MSNQWRYILASLILITSLGTPSLFASQKFIDVDELEAQQHVLIPRGENKATGKEMVVVGQARGTTTLKQTEDGPVIIPRVRVRKIVEEPSPISQPHYWRGLMFQSLGVGILGAFVADPQDVGMTQNPVRMMNSEEIVVGFGGIYYVWRSGIGAFFKVVGTSIGYQMGKAVGAGMVGRYGDPIFCGIGSALGFATTSVVVDATKHGIRSLLGWNKKVTYETFEKTE